MIDNGKKSFDKKWKGKAYPEVIAEDVTKLRTRITTLEVQVEDYKIKAAALEKCIKARDAYLDMVAQYWVGSGPVAKKLRAAICRADEEAGRS